jgi:hypothetical protein
VNAFRLLSTHVLLLLVFAIEASPTRGSIVSLDFFRVTQNNVENVASQLRVDAMDKAMATTIFGAAVNAMANDEVLFSFYNSAVVASAISEVYFDDGSILSQSTIFNSLNEIANAGSFTDFTGSGANPPNLPGGNTVLPAFTATTNFSADAAGNPMNGVDTSADILGISYTLQSGQMFDDIVDELASGELRVGMHLRAIGAEGGSDSFVNTSATNMPEPSTIAIWSLLGLVGAGVQRRRRNRAA